MAADSHGIGSPTKPVDVEKENFTLCYLFSSCIMGKVATVKRLSPLQSWGEKLIH